MSCSIRAVNLLSEVYFAVAFNAWLLLSASVAITRNHFYFSPLSSAELEHMVATGFKVIYVLELDAA